MCTLENRREVQLPLVGPKGDEPVQGELTNAQIEDLLVRDDAGALEALGQCAAEDPQ